MKKLFPLLVLMIVTIFFAGCSGLSNINLPRLGATTTPLSPANTPTRLPSATPAPTQNLFATATNTPLTFTPTVTAIGAELFTSTVSATPFPTALGFPTFFVPPDAGSVDFLTPDGSGFLNIILSSNTIYWNAGPCMPRNIEVSAIVEDVVNTDRVILFMRLREKRNTLNITDWGGGAIMLKAEDGSFHYNVRTFNIHHYYYYKEAWLEYQFVAYTKDYQEVGRTPIYDRNITLARCQPVQ